MGIDPKTLPYDLRAKYGYAPAPKKPRKKSGEGCIGLMKKAARWVDAQWGTGPGVFVPVITVSEPNRRDHWRTKSKRAKAQRESTVTMLCLHPIIAGPCHVRLTRYGEKLLDDDNLRHALKAVRDGVQDVAGVNDADPRWTWEYRQEQSPGYGVRIEVISKEGN